MKIPKLPQAATDVDTAPWWRHGYVWLVIAGPALVVIASVVTIWLAVSRPDPVLSEDYYQQGIEINKTLEAAARNGAAVPGAPPAGNALVPALQARNHAATPAATR